MKNKTNKKREIQTKREKQVIFVSFFLKMESKMKISFTKWNMQKNDSPGEKVVFNFELSFNSTTFAFHQIFQLFSQIHTDKWYIQRDLQFREIVSNSFKTKFCFQTTRISFFLSTTKKDSVKILRTEHVTLCLYEPRKIVASEHCVPDCSSLYFSFGVHV